MAKSNRKRSSRSSILKSITKKTLPTVDKGIKTVGKASKDVIETTIPLVEKGVSVVYNTMSSGLDLGVKSLRGKRKSLRSSYIGGRRRTKRTRTKRRN